jgi:hypothetical protein
MNAFDQLIEQIDSFIKKYYKNQLFKGLIFVVGISLFTFLFVIALEYFGRFSSLVRAALFFSFVSLNLFVVGKFFLIPLFKLYEIGKRISRKQAAVIIGNFFPDVSDRLLNTLQLNENIDPNHVNYELIRASVLQRSNNLSVFSFSSSIDFRTNYKYLRIVAPIIVLFISLLIFYPNFVKQGTNRVVHYTQEFVPEAPFKFDLINGNLSISEGDDLPLEVKLVGTDLPEKVYINSSNGRYLMTKISKTRYFVVLKRLTSNVSFRFEANEFSSESFNCVVSAKSAIGRFEAKLEFPSYLGRKDEVISNAGDLLVPEGTKINWSVLSKNTFQSIVKFAGIRETFNKEGFNFSKKVSNASQLSLSLYNSNKRDIDSFSYFIDVVKDQFPDVQVEESKDSISDALRYFDGSISDDYGLTSLYFVYEIRSKNGNKRTEKVKVLNPSGNSMPFRHAVDFRREKLELEDKIDYYFLVYDNDGVNGSKSSRSKTFTYELPTLSELNDKRDESNAETQDQLEKLLDKTKDFKKDIELLKKDISNSKSNDWKQNNKVQELKQDQFELQNELQQIQDKMNESLMEKDQLSELDKELLEKQELLQKLLEEVMDDELKDLLNKLEELMKNQNKEQLQDNLEKLDMKSDDMNKQLDRSLEMLKKMQVNEKIDDAVKELKELSKEQEDLKKAVEENKIDDNKAVEKQDEINKKFEEIQKDLDDLQKLNEELKKPLYLNMSEDIEKELSDELKEAKENLEKKKDKKAGENQDNGAKKMEQMAQQLEDSQKEANKKQDEEDIDLLRNILESLMILSFTQEDVLGGFSSVKDKDPFYTKLGKRQRRIVDDTKIVEDSLNAIAQRQPKIASFINKELNDINLNFKYGLENIDEHKRKDLGNNLQYVMTSYNNLALMLNESLQQMQQQMQQQMPGSGSCDKPGGKGKKPKEGEGEDMKETLKKQLEKMQKGPNPGGNKPGDKEGQGMMGLGNKEIAKMAAQQTAIRQKLEQMRNEMNKEGKGAGNKLNPLINELEKQEKDLINQRFSKEMITRQKDILTRLLESEKALLERGFEEKRESKIGKNVFLSNQKRIDEYNNQKLKQIELLRSVDPVFRKYYKDKANDYFNFVK